MSSRRLVGLWLAFFFLIARIHRRSRCRQAHALRSAARARYRCKWRSPRLTIFTSIPDLARKIRRYITRYNEDPKPIRWTYSNPAHRITTDSADTVH